MTNFDNWGPHQFVKVLLVNVSRMLYLSNFITLFHCQSFVLYRNIFYINLQYRPRTDKQISVLVLWLVISDTYITLQNSLMYDFTE